MEAHLHNFALFRIKGWGLIIGNIIGIHFFQVEHAEVRPCRDAVYRAYCCFKPYAVLCQCSVWSLSTQETEIVYTVHRIESAAQPNFYVTQNSIKNSPTSKCDINATFKKTLCIRLISQKGEHLILKFCFYREASYDYFEIIFNWL